MKKTTVRLGTMVMGFMACLFTASASFAEPNATGQNGLFRVTSAQVPPAGEFSLSVHDSYFSQKDLLSADYTLSKNTVRPTVGYTPLKFLEVSIGTNVESSKLSISGGSSQIAQTSGDIDLNVKGSYGVLPELTVGGRLRGIFYTTFEKIGYELGATSYGLDLLATYDFTQWAPSLPLKATVNVGYFLDNTGKLTTDVPDSKPLKSDPPVSLYASDIRGDNVINLGLGFEVPLQAYYITPLLEVAAQFANTYSIYKENDTHFETVTFTQNPLIITPGIRVTPPVEGLNVDVGVDIGLLSGKIKQDVGIGVTKDVSVTPQWTALLAVSYAFTPMVRKATPLPQPEAAPH